MKSYKSLNHILHKSQNIHQSKDNYIFDKSQNLYKSQTNHNNNQNLRQVRNIPNKNVTQEDNCIMYHVTPPNPIPLFHEIKSITLHET